MLVIMVFEMVSNTRELLFLVETMKNSFYFFFFNFLVIKDILIIKIIIIITL
jgi:hypothetical protein